jgi:hypothetical protein
MDTMHHSESQEELINNRNGGAGLGTLGTASRVGGPIRYTADVIFKMDALIERCRQKLQKMDNEYKKLYQVLINSE